jgi:hypothetical protein
MYGLAADPTSPVTDAEQQAITGFLLKSPTPTSSDLVGFLKLYSPADQIVVATALISQGVSSQAISQALTWLDASDKIKGSSIWGILTLVSAAASGFHGYRRNQSIWWSAVWFTSGLLFPIFTPVVGLAQGFGKRKAS